MSVILNLNDTTPVADAGYRLGKWQKGASPAGTDPTTGQPYYDASVQFPIESGIGIAGITIDGGGSTPATGTKGFYQVPYSGTITGWTLLADVSGSAVITVKKSTFAGFPTTTSIVASAPPTLTSQQNATSTTLTGWTTAVTAGDVLEYDLTSVSTVTRLTLEIQITKS
jgi:hypothetical protein